MRRERPCRRPAAPGEAAAVTRGPSLFGDRDTRRRNFRLGVWTGIIFQGGQGFIDSYTVIPVLLSGFTRSNTLIGLASAIEDIGWFLPQVLVAPWASRLARQTWLYRVTAVVRSLALFTIAAMAWPLRDNPALLLSLFFPLYSLCGLAAGFGAVAFLEIVGRTVPPRRLGTFFSRRMLWGGLAGALAGLVVREALHRGDTRMLFPLLFGLGGALCSVSYVLFSAVREPDHPPEPTAASPVALLREGLDWLRHDALFRRLFLARAGLSVWLTASPFLVLFAIRDLGGGSRAAGTFLMARTAGFVLSNLLWHELSRRRGNRAIMRVATGASCALLLAAAVVAGLSPWGLDVIPVAAAVIALEVIVCLGGAAHSGIVVGYAALLIGTAPPGKRQAFVSIMNTFIGPTMFLPALGGALVDWTNAPVVFILCAAAGLVAYRAAVRLPEGRPTPDIEAVAAPIEHGEDR